MAMKMVRAWLTAGMVLTGVSFAFILASWRMEECHGNPICPRCDDQYTRGYEEGIMSLQKELVKHGFAVYDDGGTWRPVRQVTMDKLLKGYKR